METEAYLQYVECVIQRRNKQQWRLDLSWLQSKEITIPETLKDVSLPS